MYVTAIWQFQKDLLLCIRKGLSNKIQQKERNVARLHFYSVVLILNQLLPSKDA